MKHRLPIVLRFNWPLGYKMIIYSILNQKAKSWWYHVELRAQGRIEEARRGERRLIRDSVRRLREARDNGGWLTIARGGWALHYRHGARIEHYGGLDQPIPQACLLLGIPIIDRTTIPDDSVIGTLRFPMIGFAGHIDPEPWGSMSYAPLDYVARLYQGLGATVYNKELPA